jgi:hypothetical protein
MTFSPSKRGSCDVHRPVVGRVLFAGDALAGVQHRVERFAGVVGKPLRLDSVSARSQS